MFEQSNIILLPTDGVTMMDVAIVYFYENTIVKLWYFEICHGFHKIYAWYVQEYHGTPVVV